MLWGITVCPARLYIIDENDTVRSALVDRLDRAANLTVVGHAGDAELVLRDIRSDKPDVVLVEVKRSDGMGLEIVRQIASLPKSPQLVVLTSYSTEWEEAAAHRAGATSYLLKDIDSEDLIRRISELAEL